jgi:hypothetical protein
MHGAIEQDLLAGTNALCRGLWWAPLSKGWRQKAVRGHDRDLCADASGDQSGELGQVDGHFANRKLNELTDDELAAFEKRLANAEPQQQTTGQGANE